MRQWCNKVILIIGLWVFSGFQAMGESEIRYHWDRIYYGEIGGQERLLYTGTFSRSQLAFVDIDGDFDDDLFLGKEDGHIAYFENQGTKAEPVFRLITENYEAWYTEVDEEGNHASKRSKPIDVGDHSVPAFVDIDGDEDFDLFVGSKDGTIFYYRNGGNSLLPLFELDTPSYMSLRPGTNSVPRFADFNSDRVMDLMVGVSSGEIYLYLNEGTKQHAKYCKQLKTEANAKQRCLHPAEVLGSIAPDVDASPTAVDWDYDGDLDIVVGKASGKMSLFINTGNMFEGQWKFISDRFLFIDAGGYASPAFYDLGEDGFPDLFLGTSTSEIVFYLNREVFQTALNRSFEGLWDGMDWTLSPLEVLEVACKRLGGDQQCFPKLASAFSVPDDVNASLEDYASYILRPKGILANAVDIPDTPSKAQREGAAEEGQGGAAVEEGAQDAEEMTEDQAFIPGDSRLLQPVVQVNAPEDNAPAGAAKNAAEGQAEDVAKNTKAQLRHMEATRNNFWLATRNYLNIVNFVENEGYSTVTSGDWNQDGLTDLLFGSQSGRIFLYTNVGDKETPRWKLEYSPSFLANQRKHSSPAFIDVDQDGDLDVLTGKKDGRIEMIIQNTTKKPPRWEIHDLFYQNIDVGSYSAPNFYDIDGDKDLDLFVGNIRGYLIFYLNESIGKKSRFVLKSTNFSHTTVSRNASPSFFDWNDDSSVDLVLGGREGDLKLVLSQSGGGESSNQGWEESEVGFDMVLNSKYVSPHFADLNHDGKADFLVGDKKGNLMLWMNDGFEVIELDTGSDIAAANSLELEDEEVGFEDDSTLEEHSEDELLSEEEEVLDVPFDPVYTLENKNFGELRTGRRSCPAFFDYDGDGDLDLLIGNKEGLLLFYKNEGSPEMPRWELTEKRFAQYNHGRNSTPVFVDLDQDDDLDLVVGNETGRLQYWENRQGSGFSSFLASADQFIGVTAGRNARPIFWDFNEDGKPDILLGNFRGQLVLYHQTPKAKGFKFQLKQRKFLGFDVGIGATPVIADLNNDKVPEIIIGSDKGTITALFQDPSAPGGWKKDNRYFDQLKVPVGSFPSFADIDGDGDLDMFIGSEDGPIYFYRNDGTPEIE